MTAVMAYIPFLYPIHGAHHWWYLLMVPLAFGISMIYKAIRMRSLEPYWRHVVVMTLQIIIALIGMALGLAVLVLITIPTTCRANTPPPRWTPGLCDRERRSRTGPSG